MRPMLPYEGDFGAVIDHNVEQPKLLISNESEYSTLVSVRIIS